MDMKIQVHIGLLYLLKLMKLFILIVLVYSTFLKEQNMSLVIKIMKFDNEIKERKDTIKKINKYLVSFDYLDKIFITLSASFSTLSIASYATVVGLPVGIAGSSLTLIFTIITGINKSLLLITKKRKKKQYNNNISKK